MEVVHWKKMLKLLAWCETLYTQELHVCAPLRSTVFWAQPIKFELSRNTRPPKYTQLSRNMEGVKRLSLEFVGTGYEHWGNNVTCLTASISPCKVTLWLTKALETRTACCSLLLQKVKKALNKAFPLSPLTGRKEHSNNCWYDGSIGIAILEGKASSWGCLNGLGFWRAVCVGWFCWGGGATVAMTVAVGGTGWIGCSGRMSAAARWFLDLFFFWTEVHRVRFSPVFCLFVLGLLELGVGVAGFGDVCASRLKMGSPSSSKRLEVFMSHAGYLRDGLTLVAKLASVSKSTLSGVWSSCWKWEKIVGLKLKSE